MPPFAHSRPRRLWAAWAAVILCLGAAGSARAAGDAFMAERYYYFMRSFYQELSGDDASALKSLLKGADLGRGYWYLKKEAARLASRSGDNQAALKYAREALALKPGDISVLLLAAWLGEAEGDQETAEREYLKVLELDKNNGEALYLLGKLYLKQRRFKETEKVFRRLAAADPGAEPHFHLSHLYQILGRNKEAVAALTTALRKDPDFPEAWEELARLQEKSGRPKAAERAWRRLIELRPLAVPPKNELARFLLKSGRKKEAEQLLTETLRDESRLRRDVGPPAEEDGPEAGLDGADDASRLKMRLGLLYLNQGLHREAAGEFEAVLKSRPQNVQARYFLASALLEKAEGRDKSPDRERAVKLLEDIGPDAPFYIKARLLLSDAARGARDEREAWERSLAVLETAALARPDSVHLRLVQALVLERLEEKEKAYALLRRAAADFPREAEISFRLGVLEDHLGRKPAAIEAMRQAIALNPRHADALNYLAYTWAERRENLDEALTMAEKADALKPNQGYIIDTLAWIHHQMGRPQKALPLLRWAVPLSNRDPVVLDHLGDVLMKLNRKKEALEAYRQALKSDLTDREAIKSIHEKIKEIAP